MAARPAGRRGQALAELVLLLPVLLALLVAPLLAARWGEQRIAVLDAAREAAWETTVSARVAKTAGSRTEVRITRDDDGLVLATARADAPASVAPLTEPVRTERPEPVRASLLLYTVPLDAGTEPRAEAAIRRGWLAGAAGAPARGLLRLLLGEDPVRIDFDARPEVARP